VGGHAVDNADGRTRRLAGMSRPNRLIAGV
jgi:hypothetical protein